MKFERENPEKPLEGINITHNGAMVNFKTKAYSTNKTGFEEVFGIFNAYISTLSNEKQNKLFKNYQEIHNSFESVFDISTLRDELIVLTSRIYELIDETSITNWVQLKSDIQYPLDLKTELPIEFKMSEEKVKMTYLRRDYILLVIMSLALRAMVPIWSEFVVRQDTEENGTYKEYEGLRLIRNTWLAKCEAMERMTGYLTCIAARQEISMSPTLAGLAKTEIPTWLLALTVVRRLSCTELSSTDSSVSIISKVFNFIDKSTLRSLDRRFEGMVNDKGLSKSGGAEEADNPSMLEKYKIKQAVSDGSIELINHYAEDPEKVALHIDPTIDVAKLHMCILNAQETKTPHIATHQRLLTQWVMHHDITARAFGNIDIICVYNMVAVTQALMWHWGLNDLACLMTVKPSDDWSFDASIRKDVSRDYIEKLIAIYPHYYNHEKQDTIEKAAKKNNVGMKGIDLCTKALIASQWRSEAPAELLKSSWMEGKGAVFALPVNIRDQLAELLIKISTLSE